MTDALLADNPLYHMPFLPAFDRMLPEQAEPAVRALLTEAEAAVAELEQAVNPSWAGLMDPLYRACHPLYDAWGAISHLLSVMNSEGWRKAYEALQPEMVAFGLRVSQSKSIYAGYRTLREGDAWEALSESHQRILTSAIRAAEQAGIGLAGAEQEQFNAIKTELAELGTTFSNHLLDAVKAYGLDVSEAEAMEGLPETLRESTARAARESGRESADAAHGPWRVTLAAPVLMPFLKHCPRAELRETLYRAHVSKASSGEVDNGPLVPRILELRREMAALLGYGSFAEMSLACKMAPDVAAVYAMFDELGDVSCARARDELSELEAFARGQGFDGERLMNWDVAFWAERMREARFAFSDEDLRPYFQFPRVLEGLFALAERLFDVRIAAADGDAPVWHEDVRFFRVADMDGTARAFFYLDPYCRPATKRGGAWMNDLRTRDRQPDGTIQLPVAFLVCNQTEPTESHPSLMSLQEVTTLFHEFGHAIQHMLTTVEDPEASGINNIEWDAVELASQFMENWCYDHGTVKGLSAHVETGEPLPDALFEKVLAARTYRSASAMVRQLLFSALDMDLHARFPSQEHPTVEAVKQAAVERYAVMPLLPEDRSLCGFAHIFAGGYAAGYYSYKWSEVLSADAFAAFEEAGLDDEQAVRSTGRRYRGTVLALGGGTAPTEVFKAFRGREPRVDALLRHFGLV